MMATVQGLNDRFGIEGQLRFCEGAPARGTPPDARPAGGPGAASGLIIAEIGNMHATASLCLQGAHLMTWQPKNQAVPVIWLSREARLAEGKSIRGGVPVCWPWFGAHASDASLPAHGFARTVPWEVIETGAETNGATRLLLRLTGNAKSQLQWPHQARLELKVIVGETLHMELITENTGTSEIAISEALHTYFRVGDIGSVCVTGLSGRKYWDKAGGGSALREQDGAISFSAETDRVYIDSADECIIEDSQLRRRIHITKTGSLSTVVWTPWYEKAARMGDMGQPDGWREMLCVESANAFENTLKIPPGGRHMLGVEYRAESF